MNDTEKKYVRADGGYCPVCYSERVSVQDKVIFDSFSKADFICGKCKSEWSATYMLSDCDIRKDNSLGSRT